jgi:hypothetical protein
MDVASWWVRICSLVSHSADDMFAFDWIVWSGYGFWNAKCNHIRASGDIVL